MRPRGRSAFRLQNSSAGSRGRNLLRDPLTRRGITLAAAGWGIALTCPPISAETRAQLFRQVCQSGPKIPVSASVAKLVAGFSRASIHRWLVASALMTIGLAVGVAAYALRPSTPPIPPPASKPSHEPGNILQADVLPAGAIVRFGSPRLIDFTISKSATFSPDGKLFATSGQNSPLCVWDAATGKLVRKHVNLGSVFDLRCAPMAHSRPSPSSITTSF